MNFKRGKPKERKHVDGPGGPGCHCCRYWDQSNAVARTPPREQRRIASAEATREQAA